MSLDLTNLQVLKSLLGYRPLFQSRYLACQSEFIIGWGRKRSGNKAVELALSAGKDYFLAEDGFVRSVDRSDPSLSLVLDGSGIFYDATSSCDLEMFICQNLTQDQHARAEKLMMFWRLNRISKYNGAREYELELPDKYILVVDQVVGDLSIKYGLASASSFHRMLDAALRENPGVDIIVKLHPDVYTRNAASHFDLVKLKKMQHVRVIAEDCHPVRLIEHADAVYTVTSQIGFEALIWGKKVRTFGLPFYAGWGLSHDEFEAPPRRFRVSLAQLVYATLVRYPRYIDPVTDEQCEVERAFEYIQLQRQMRLELASEILSIKFSRWKKPIIRGFLQGSALSFRTALTEQDIQSKKHLAIWGAKLYQQTRARQNVYRIEDGFLRSSGLGADLVRPVSMVIDDVGIYFDATKPSQLENFLNNHAFTDRQLQRASTLRDRIVELSLSKYNVDCGSWRRPSDAKRVILVVGQVDSDASIEYGAPETKTNFDLLKRVRAENKYAFIIYKPHPDLLANLRRSNQREIDMRAYCDVILGNVDLSSLFSQVDEVHTMTSLMGFEALLRGVKVTCYGLPFYAGWGLTEDKLDCERRKRYLTLEQLVYGTLVKYPRYMHPKKSIFVEPETAVEQLAKSKNSGIQTRNLYRKLIHFVAVGWAHLRKSDRP